MKIIPLRQIKWFVRPTFIFEQKSIDPNYNLIDGGQYNGYVAVRPDHPWYSKNYDDIDIEIHGGLTYSNFLCFDGFKIFESENRSWWVVGFDTLHLGDTWDMWNKEAVENETRKLYKQALIALK